MPCCGGASWTQAGGYRNLAYQARHRFTGPRNLAVYQDARMRLFRQSFLRCSFLINSVFLVILVLRLDRIAPNDFVLGYPLKTRWI
jgi:hypothetical protein